MMATPEANAATPGVPRPKRSSDSLTDCDSLDTSTTSESPAVVESLKMHNTRHRQNSTGQYTKPYYLNVSKTALKKIEACNREHQVKLVPTGGGFRLFFQAGCFEAFRYCLKELYNCYPKPDFKVTHDTDCDGKNNKVIQRYRVSSMT